MAQLVAIHPGPRMVNKRTKPIETQTKPNYLPICQTNEPKNIIRQVRRFVGLLHVRSRFRPFGNSVEGQRSVHLLRSESAGLQQSRTARMQRRTFGPRLEFHEKSRV